MTKMLTKIAKFPYVAHVDDERADGNSIIVTLHNDYDFVDDPGCGTKGFETDAQAWVGCMKDAVIKVRGN